MLALYELLRQDNLNRNAFGFFLTHEVGGPRCGNACWGFE